VRVAFTRALRFWEADFVAIAMCPGAAYYLRSGREWISGAICCHALEDDPKVMLIRYVAGSMGLV